MSRIASVPWGTKCSVSCAAACDATLTSAPARQAAANRTYIMHLGGGTNAIDSANGRRAPPAVPMHGRLRVTRKVSGLRNRESLERQSERQKQLFARSRHELLEPI